MAEFQLTGAVCQQLNILFEFDVEKAIEDVKDRQMPGELDGADKEARQERGLSPHGNSQYSSLGGEHTDVYDAEGSDVDDLDNEVRNISKQHRIRREIGAQGSAAVNHEDIMLDMEDEDDKIQ